MRERGRGVRLKATTLTFQFIPLLPKFLSLQSHRSLALWQQRYSARHKSVVLSTKDSMPLLSKSCRGRLAHVPYCYASLRQTVLSAIHAGRRLDLVQTCRLDAEHMHL